MAILIGFWQNCDEKKQMQSCLSQSQSNVSRTIGAMAADTTGDDSTWGGVHLLDLPESVLNAIAQHTSNRHAKCHPMLALATATRDVVLRNLKRIRLNLAKQQPQPASTSHHSLARLLNRACREAAPGLDVELNMKDQVDALPEVLQPGLDSGGWHNVSKLEVRTMPGRIPGKVYVCPDCCQQCWVARY
jgi:hypothetical protein